MKDDTREMLKRMRGKKYIPETKKSEDKPKDLDMRDMLKITRNMSLTEAEQVEEPENKKTIYDQGQEEDKMRAAFDDLNVAIEFEPIEVYDNYIFFAGTIDRIVDFVYKVTMDETSGGYKINYRDGFKPDIESLESAESAEDDDSTRIGKRIKNYFETSFYPRWRDEILNK